MGRIQPSISDDVVNYHLPIGLLGFVNQIVNIYVYLSVTCGRRPLQPTRTIRHSRYTTRLCCIIIVFILGFDSLSMSHLDRWELTTTVAGNLVLFISFIGVALGGLWHCESKQAEAGSGPQIGADEASSTTTTMHEDLPPPPYSEDLESGHTVIDDKTQASNLVPPYVSSQEIVGATENPSNKPPSREADMTDSLSISTTLKEDTTEPHTTQTQAQSDIQAQAKAQKETDTGAALYMLISNMPGTIPLFAGLAGHLAHNLPADWADSDQIQTIVFAHSILLGATVLGMAVWLLRLACGRPRTDEEVALQSKLGWKDCIFHCSMIFSFFIVSFNNWLLAGLVDDITGAKHLLSYHCLPLVYMLVTKLPALAI